MFLCLAKGQIGCAFYYNALVVTLAIAILPYIIYKVYRYIKYGDKNISKKENIIIYIIVFLSLLFGIVRNFDFWMLY